MYTFEVANRGESPKDRTVGHEALQPGSLEQGYRSTGVLELSIPLQQANTFHQGRFDIPMECQYQESPSSV